MAAILSFTVIGGEAVQRGLTALLEQMKDLRPFWRDVFAPKYFGMVQDLFATGGRARGGGGKFKSGAWAQLSPKYRIWKQQHYPGQPILVREGVLRESVRWSGKALGPGGIFDAHPSFVVAGTAIPYGKYHDTGTSRMPARPFLPLPDPAVFAPLMQAWLLKKKGP
jgi:phage gpG-like protein